MARRLLVAVVAVLAAVLAATPACARFSVRSLPLGSSPEHLLVVPSIDRVFVAVVDDRQVAVLRVADDSIEERIAVGGLPFGLAFDEIRGRLLVVMPDKVEAYERGASGWALSAEVPTGLGFPSSTLYDPLAGRLLVTDYHTVGIGTVDGASLRYELIARPVRESWQLSLDLRHRRLLAPASATGLVGVLDAADLSEQASIQSATRVRAACYDGDRNRVWMVGPGLPIVHLMDLDTGIDQVLPAGEQPWDLVLDPATDVLYVGNASSPFLTRVDGTTLATGAIALPAPARTVVLDDQARRLFAVDLTRSQVSVVDLRSESWTATYAVEAGPRFAALEPRSHKLYTSGSTAGTLSILSPAANASQSEMWASPAAIPADGLSTSLITVRPLDDSGQPLGPGHQVEIRTTAGLLLGTVADLGNGDYTQSLQATLAAETAILTGLVDGVPLATRPRVSFELPGYASIVVSEPEWGVVAGGTPVTLTGTGFLPGGRAAGRGDRSAPTGYVEVFFGGAPAVVLDVTDSEIACLTPPHAVGTVDVSVVKYDTDQIRTSWLRGGFTYVEAGEPALRAAGGQVPGEVLLDWGGPGAGPVRVIESARPDFAGPLSEMPGAAEGRTNLIAPSAPRVLYYRIER